MMIIGKDISLSASACLQPHVTMILQLLLSVNLANAQYTMGEAQFLNELPMENLLRMKNSLHTLVGNNYDNFTPSIPESNFGAQAMALRTPYKRTDHDDLQKKGDSKISNIFSMSVTTLAFLAFGGYLLCLIVQAVRAKQAVDQSAIGTPGTATTVFVNSGLKKKPQTHFASYGRRKRESRRPEKIDLPPEQLFTVLKDLCEGYAKWSELYRDKL